jgi:hypothetical protein
MSEANCPHSPSAMSVHGAPAACKAIANGPVHRVAQDRQDASQKHTDVREQILYSQHAALCYIVVVVNVLSPEPDNALSDRTFCSAHGDIWQDRGGPA